MIEEWLEEEERVNLARMNSEVMILKGRMHSRALKFRMGEVELTSVKSLRYLTVINV